MEHETLFIAWSWPLFGMSKIPSAFRLWPIKNNLVHVIQHHVSLTFRFTQNIQVRQQWRWARNLRFSTTHNTGGLATLYTNHQQHTNTMSTANYRVSRYRNQAWKLEEKQASYCTQIGGHQTDNGKLGWDHQIHTSWLTWMIRNHMYTRLYQAPCQLCLTTSLLATDGITHEGPHFFTIV